MGALISLIIGVLYGGISGYFGGIVDDIMMRIVEILVGIPYMIVVIIVSMVLGKGIHSLLIALCLTSWTGLARLVRGQVISLKSSEYILAAKALGTSDFKIIRKHLFPNIVKCDYYQYNILNSWIHFFRGIFELPRYGNSASEYKLGCNGSTGPAADDVLSA